MTYTSHLYAIHLPCMTIFQMYWGGGSLKYKQIPTAEPLIEFTMGEVGVARGFARWQ